MTIGELKKIIENVDDELFVEFIVENAGPGLYGSTLFMGTLIGGQVIEGEGCFQFSMKGNEV